MLDGDQRMIAADPRGTVRPFVVDGVERGRFASLVALEEQGYEALARRPASLRIVLESALRHAGADPSFLSAVDALARWQPAAPRVEEIPFVVARIIAPDASGIPLLADLAAMRDRALELGLTADAIEPRVPVDVIVDHSLEVEQSASHDALTFNMRREIERNEERYRFLKWAAKAFDAVRVIPPGVGIIHQVNLEYLARIAIEQDGLWYPDTLVGTDSHTSMINGMGVVAWGVGGIEAEAAMLGQPIHFLMPDVIGVHLQGALPPGVMITDLALTIVERLRSERVVGQFVEFFGYGAAALAAADRSMIANMAPEYGATIGFFAVDERTLAHLRAIGRSNETVHAVEAYFRAQRLFGVPRKGEIDYSRVVEIDLASIVPSVAGPRRPQDRIALAALKSRFGDLLTPPRDGDGFGKAPAQEVRTNAPQPAPVTIGHGAVVIAAITSCSNTSNPGALIAAGLLARRAVARGLVAAPYVKTSFTPGSQIVDEYLRQTGLQADLDVLGFHIVGHACATCMGNSGPLPGAIDDAIARDDLIVAAVLSGNRNFEARIHPAVRANFLMSPPLVVAFAIAGRIDIDLTREPLGYDPAGNPVFLREVWPDEEEIAALVDRAYDPRHARHVYAHVEQANPLWQALAAPDGPRFAWDPASTYLLRPPFVDQVTGAAASIAPILDARALVVLGDSVTTDHVSPAGRIGHDSPAGAHLRALGLAPRDFNSFIARRGNHDIMMRGTFDNVRLRNALVPDREGGWTRHAPDGAVMSIYDAAMAYAKEGIPVVVIAGREYGTGSSRDWAAKGPRLLGVRAVIAKSFERIHRSNLVGMGVLPCEFERESDADALELVGDESFDLLDVDGGVTARQSARLRVRRADGTSSDVPVRVRADTPIEARYLDHGGILPFTLRQMVKDAHGA